MKAFILYLVLLASATSAVRAQGTLVYDQESSTDEAYTSGGAFIQAFGTVGQSFTPSLSTVGFFRVKVYDIYPGNTLGATLVMNLRSGSISGPILGTTVPVVLTNGFAGSMNFFLAAPIQVTPATTYYMETVVQSGDSWGARTLGDVYSGGVFYGGGGPATGNDLWFREGIVVPEPTSASFLLIGSMALAFVVRRKPTNR